MSDIDYIRNVQAVGVFDGTTNQFKCNLSGVPVDNPPHICKIKQISFMTVETDLNLYTLWSDMVNDNVASFTNDTTTICPDTTILLKRPIVGDIYFTLLSLQSNLLQPITDSDANIILNLEFIRYNKN